MFSLFHAVALNSIRKGKSVASYFFVDTTDVVFFLVFVFVFIFLNHVYHSLPSVLVV